MTFLHGFVAFTLKQALSDLHKTSLKNLAVRASNPCPVECAPDGTPSWYLLENGTILEQEKSVGQNVSTSLSRSQSFKSEGSGKKDPSVKSNNRAFSFAVVAIQTVGQEAGNARATSSYLFPLTAIKLQSVRTPTVHFIVSKKLLRLLRTNCSRSEIRRLKSRI